MKRPPLNWRFADRNDVERLAEMNRQLIEDQGHRNRMSREELARRMEGWIGEAGSYRAVLFFEETDRSDPAAYALFRPGEDERYLRQFFVARDRRRRGIGRAAMSLLFDEIWPKNLRLTVDVLAGNHAAIEFWKAVGYRPYRVTLEILSS